MLSYRHAFHAGNHADVLKHFCLYLVLRYYNQKNKDYWYIDTHAGAGLYDLRDAFSQKNAEYQSGIELIYRAEHLCQPLEDFKQHLINTLPEKWLYCGSPYLAASLLRENDKMRLFEMHPSDVSILKENMANILHHKKYLIKQSDGFDGLKSVLPPPTRRAVILTDPPYEDKNDYVRVISAFQVALKRFANGCYILWYPCLSRQESQRLPEELKKAFPNNTLNVQLNVESPSRDGFGMFGSGVFILNPPYILAQELTESLPELSALLSNQADVAYCLESTVL